MPEPMSREEFDQVLAGLVRPDTPGWGKAVGLSAAYAALLAENERLREAAQFKCNAIICDSDGFIGSWVAVPREDFDRLRAALRGEEGT